MMLAFSPAPTSVRDVEDSHLFGVGPPARSWMVSPGREPFTACWMLENCIGTKRLV
jgi:hypothetical protein